MCPASRNTVVSCLKASRRILALPFHMGSTGAEVESGVLRAISKGTARLLDQIKVGRPCLKTSAVRGIATVSL